MIWFYPINIHVTICEIDHSRQNIPSDGLAGTEAKTSSKCSLGIDCSGGGGFTLGEATSPTIDDLVVSANKSGADLLSLWSSTGIISANECSAVKYFGSEMNS